MEDIELDRQLCAMCKKLGTKICKGCNCSRYCSQQCQEADWHVHKLLCKKFKNLETSAAPSLSHQRGILFRERGDGPEFVWILTRPDTFAEVNGKPQILSSGPIEITNHPDLGYVEPSEGFGFNKAIQRMHQPIVYRARLGAPQDNSGRKPTGAANQGMKKIDEELRHLIFGPALFYGLSDHLDTIDFRHIIDFLRRAYHEAWMHQENSPPPDEPIVEGSRMNCKGDIDIIGRPDLEPFHLLRKNLDAGPFSIAIGDIIEIPLLGVRVPQALPWRDRKTRMFEPALNAALGSLSPTNWSVAGSVIVVRKDGKPLPVDHLKAITSYCAKLVKGVVFEPLTAAETTDITPQLEVQFRRKEELIRQRASKEGFVAFYRLFETLHDPDDHLHPSPYYM